MILRTLLILASFPASAQTVEPSLFGDPLLWKVESAAATTYLLGTIHRGVSSDRLDPAVIAAFKQAKIFVTETVDEPGVASKVDLVLPAQQRLDQLLSKSAWQVALQQSRVPEADLRHFKPCAAFLFVVINTVEPPPGEMDRELEGKARQAKKKLESLETEKEGFAFLERAFTAERVTRLLEDFNLSRATKESQDDLAEYRSGNVGAIEKRLSTGKPYEQEARKILVFERNRFWLPKIERQIAAGGAFIAVGSDHLLGPEGIIALLAQKGYKVSRIRTAGGLLFDGPEMAKPLKIVLPSDVKWE